MITEVVFHPIAYRSWEKLDNSLKSKFAIKLRERMVTPEIPKDRLSGPLTHCFKIRMIREGYRLVYQPFHDEGFLFVRSVGRRDEAVYSQAVESFIDS